LQYIDISTNICIDMFNIVVTGTKGMNAYTARKRTCKNYQTTNRISV